NLSGPAGGATAGTLLTSTGITVSLGGTLRLSNDSTAATGVGNNTDRVGNAVPINLINGTLNFNTSTTAAGPYAETLGPLSVQSYFNTVSTNQVAAGQTSALTFASLTRTNKGSVNFVGTGLGADTRN